MFFSTLTEGLKLNPFCKVQNIQTIRVTFLENYSMSAITSLSSIGAFTPPDNHNHKASIPLQQAQQSHPGEKKQAFPRSSGSTMRRILSRQNNNPSSREKTDLLQTYQYHPDMTLPADYEIVSHLSTDGREFKVAGKRMEGDSSRFYAKNASTGETLCTLKRTPTEGGFVWMHPEDTGLRGGTDANSSSRLPEELTNTFLDQLRLVGESKLIGYHEFAMLTAIGTDEATQQRKAEERGMKTVVLKLSWSSADPKPDCLVVYDQKLLQNYLNKPENKPTLEKHKWPTDADLFAKKIMEESTLDEDLRDLVAVAFNNSRPPYRKKSLGRSDLDMKSLS